MGVRFAAIGCLVGVAVTHQLDLQDKLDEAPYLAAMFIALIWSSFGLALVFAAARRVPDGVWLLCAAVAGGPSGEPQARESGRWAAPH